MKIYRDFFCGIAYMGIFIVFIFGVHTLEQAIPKQMYVEKGESVDYDFGVPATFVLEKESVEVESMWNQNLISAPCYKVSCRLLGIFPVKEIEVIFVDGDSICIGGMPIGIYAKMQGVMVIGAGKVEDSNGNQFCPAENLLQPGDYIMSINGEPVDEKEKLQELVTQFGNGKETIGVRRNGEYIEVSVEPARSVDGTYMLGVWVRDDLAGIGTMTYFDENGKFGALGHAVSDGDTGKKIELENGKIYGTKIIGIRKGETGSPGELSGVIDYQEENRLGTITDNSTIGIYGVLDGNISSLIPTTTYGISFKQNIKIGQAYIVSGISGELKEYQIEIESLDYSGREENKGITFKVVDQELLNLTGGIVQGMFTSYNGNNTRKPSKIKGLWCSSPISLTKKRLVFCAKYN